MRYGNTKRPLPRACRVYNTADDIHASSHRSLIKISLRNTSSFAESLKSDQDVKFINAVI